MKNITLSVDDETYRQARLLAAKREQSVSALVRDLINESVNNPALVAREPRAKYLVEPPAQVAVKPTASKRSAKKTDATSDKPVKEMSFVEFMRASPWYGTKLDLKRDKHPYVPKNLFGEEDE
jgi:hypothetical protein